MFTKASCPDTRKRRLLARAALLGSSAAAQPATASFTGSRGQAPRHRHTLEDLPEFAQPPHLLLYCHGDHSGAREGILDFSRRANPGFVVGARRHGVVPRIAAPPLPRDGAAGTGVRHWHREDMPPVQEVRQFGPAFKFPVDHDSVASRRVSRAVCRLKEFAVARGTGCRGVLPARRGCFDLGATRAQRGNFLRFREPLQGGCSGNGRELSCPAAGRCLLVP